MRRQAFFAQLSCCGNQSLAEPGMHHTNRWGETSPFADSFARLPLPSGLIDETLRTGATAPSGHAESCGVVRRSQGRTVTRLGAERWKAELVCEYFVTVVLRHRDFALLWSVLKRAADSGGSRAGPSWSGFLGKGCLHFIPGIHCKGGQQEWYRGKAFSLSSLAKGNLCVRRQVFLCQ